MAERAASKDSAAAIIDMHRIVATGQQMATSIARRLLRHARTKEEQVQALAHGRHCESVLNQC